MFGGVQIHETNECTNQDQKCSMYVVEQEIGRLQLVEAVGPNGEVTGLDFSKNMLKVGEEKLKRYFKC